MEKFDHSYILVEIKSGGTSLQTRYLMIFQKHYEPAFQPLSFIPQNGSQVLEQ